MRHGVLPLLVALLAPALIGAAPAPSVPTACADCPAVRLDEPRFDSIGDAVSIPDGVVSSLAEDHQGFLWIGTAGGLVRYDGHRFRLHGSRRGDPGSLSAGFIRALLVAQDGRLWVGTESDGVAVYDPSHDRFEVFRSDGDNEQAAVDRLSAGSVRALAETADGHIWVGIIGGGLDELDPRSGEIRHHRPGAAGSLNDDRVQALLVDRNQTLWVGTWDGLHQRRADSDVFEPVLDGADALASLSGEIINQLFQAADGQIWVGTQAGDLLRIDPLSGEVHAVARADSEQSARRSSVYALAQPNASQLWVGRASGIEVRDASDGRLLREVRHDPARPNGLAGNEVRALLRDRSGLIWSGGYGGGVQRHNTGNTAFRVRGPEGPDGGVLRDANFRSVLELSDGRLWLGTQENGVAILDAELQLIDAVRPKPGAPNGLGAGRVTGLAQTRNGEVWLGGDAGLYRYDLSTRRLHAYRAGQGRARRLLADPNGDLWIATEDGLFRHEFKSDRIERLSAENGEQISGDVNALALDHEGRLWVGTESGLAVLDAGATHLRRLRNDSSNGLRHALVLGMLIDSKQQLWVDTPEGLHRLTAFDGEQAAFDAVSVRLGIGGRPFGANLLEDDSGRIWTHLFVFDPASDKVHELTQADGVDIGTGWFRAYQRTRDGRLLFGGSRGLLIVDPARFRPSNYAPPVVVTELKVDGEVVAPGVFAQGLELHPGQRSFSVEFSALDFSAPERCLYQYRLQGYDERWNDTDASFRVAAYGNLAPGRYRLEIRGSNRSGEWSPQTLALDVRVLPAWWQHWLFRFAMVVLAFLLVWLLVYLRTRYLHQRRQLLEVKVAERTAELEAVSQALQEKSLALEEASVTDPLTGLRNRRFLSQHIDTDIALSIRQHEAQLRLGHPAVGCDLIFFMIDIDHFKSVNDIHGHSAGDAVLVQMTERLRLVFRDSDYLIRWGGEEFLIVARATDRSYATILAERARRQVAEQPFVIGDGVRLAKTCSIGFAGFPLQPEYPRALAWTDVVDVVDLALYAAKRAGRDGWVGLQTVPGPAIGGEIKRDLPELCRQSRITVLSSLPMDQVMAGLGDPGGH